jgi:hypothetical protein
MKSFLSVVLILLVSAQLSVERMIRQSGSNDLPASVCRRNGSFRHPTDCRRFFRCVDWTHEGKQFSTFHYLCPGETVFDEDLQVCNFPSWTKPCEESSGPADPPEQDLIQDPGVRPLGDGQSGQHLTMAEQVPILGPGQAQPQDTVGALGLDADELQLAQPPTGGAEQLPIDQDPTQVRPGSGAASEEGGNPDTGYGEEEVLQLGMSQFHHPQSLGSGSTSSESGSSTSGGVVNDPVSVSGSSSEIHPESHQDSGGISQSQNGSNYVVTDESIYNCPAPGFYPHESHCRQFYVCLEVLPGILLAEQVYRCPERYLFDGATRRCRRQEKSNCAKVSGESSSPRGSEDVVVVLEHFLHAFFGASLRHRSSVARP